jgi:hypothetical protein
LAAAARIYSIEYTFLHFSIFSLFNPDFKFMALQSILRALLRVPEDHVYSENEDLSQFYIPWGFTVYRTCYSAESEIQWQILTEHIKNTLPKYVLEADEDGTGTTAQQMLSLLRLDFRSDADTLRDLDMDQVRQVFLNHAGGKPVNTELRWFGAFLLADEEVLADVPIATIPERWIKCIQADYIAADYVSKDPRRLPQRYFGWMKMTTRSLLELWDQLTRRELYSIAPETIGGAHLVACKWF